jgi:hypothetical protein
MSLKKGEDATNADLLTRKSTKSDDRSITSALGIFDCRCWEALSSTLLVWTSKLAPSAKIEKLYSDCKIV